MKNLLIALLFALSLSACVNGNDAREALESQGFTNVQITGYSFLACSEDDWYHTGFTATNAQGKQVKGTVCSGLLFKGSTVRW